MSLIARDSTTPMAIPVDTPVVLGYGDGLYQWSSSDWARFPNSVKLTIAVSPLDAGDILDVEQGDALPADCPGWADRFARPGRRAPTIYSARGTGWSVINAILAAMGGRPFDWIMATLDGTTDTTGAPKQPVAVQYLDTGAYDESLILDPTWLGGSYVAVLQPDDQAFIQQAIANALNAGTGAGQPDWAHTEQAILSTVQGLANQLTALSTQLANLGAGGLTAAQAAQLAQAASQAAAAAATVAQIQTGLRSA